VYIDYTVSTWFNPFTMYTRIFRTLTFKKKSFFFFSPSRFRFHYFRSSYNSLTFRFIAIHTTTTTRTKEKKLIHYMHYEYFITWMHVTFYWIFFLNEQIFDYKTLFFFYLQLYRNKILNFAITKPHIVLQSTHY
jgi:hypothetical protein